MLVTCWWVSGDEVTEEAGVGEELEGDGCSSTGLGLGAAGRRCCHLLVLVAGGDRSGEGEEKARARW